jgi:hypothetical protein
MENFTEVFLAATGFLGNFAFLQLAVYSGSAVMILSARMNLLFPAAKILPMSFCRVNIFAFRW